MTFKVGDWVRVLPPDATQPPNPIAELSKDRIGQVVGTYTPESQPYPYDVQFDDAGTQLCFAERELELMDRPPADRTPAPHQAQGSTGPLAPELPPGERLLRETAGLPHAMDAPKEQALMQAAVMTPADYVDRPDHYTSHPSGIECIEVTEHLDFLLGNVFKYLWRHGLKSESPSLQDLKKARWYLDRKITLEERRG
ncbi:DUF3310 domain-containing protein [Streptomyces olivoreticuli]|uniref:DUF3310 domain-containing protein n=1 Tax=Streptomyces olivoreticuli TaxID=68246 RepID=UPI002657C541|nr:DUF3310 domain-containing protein [Streptomyces olivoreticuli]WKK23054.1 DUF3310 domain-containing protein [Streptomyces olivoreticuli]